MRQKRAALYSSYLANTLASIHGVINPLAAINSPRWFANLTTSTLDDVHSSKRIC